MSRFALFSLLTFACSAFFGQKITATAIGTPEILYSENGVSISSQLTECNHEDRKEIMTFKILSIVNTTNEAVSLKVREDMYYDGQCRTCENDEYTFTFNLEANEKKSGTCYSDSNPALAVFQSMKDGYIKEVLSDLKLNIVRLH